MYTLQQLMDVTKYKLVMLQKEVGHNCISLYAKYSLPNGMVEFTITTPEPKEVKDNDGESTFEAQPLQLVILAANTYTQVEGKIDHELPQSDIQNLKGILLMQYYDMYSFTSLTTKRPESDPVEEAKEGMAEVIQGIKILETIVSSKELETLIDKSIEVGELIGDKIYRKMHPILSKLKKKPAPRKSKKK